VNRAKPKRVYRVGLVGCGAIGDESQDALQSVPGWIPFPYSHAPALAAHDQTQLVAVADPNTERLIQFCDRWEVVSRFSSIEEMLESEKLDIVVVASPTWHHAEAFIKAAEANILGVYLEKPLARSLRDADSMISAATKNGTAAVVNYFRSFDPSYRRARDLIAEGVIGEITGAVVVWGEGVSQGGCHLFDLLRMMLGSSVDWVFADLDNDPTLKDPGGSFILSLVNNIKVTVHMPWELNAPVQLEVIGKTGMIKLTHYERTITQFKVINERSVPITTPFFARDCTRSGMLVALDELIAQIEHGTSPSSGLREGRAALEITGALIESGKQHKPISLPFQDLDMKIESWL
jgi:predicted dehydrogenase